MGFGEYIYQASSALIKEYQFRKEADFYEEAILELTELPEYFHKDYETMFAALFDAYLEEGEREEMEADMDEISWILGAVIGSRGADGKPVSSR